MNLKKTDKIIAAILVVILIVAGIGIVFYVSNQEPEEEETEDEMKEYSFTWDNATKTMEIEGLANKEYTDPFTINTPSGSVLTNVEVEIDWKDDNTWGIGKHLAFLSSIFKVQGKDTLTAEIALNGGASLTHESTGSGNEVLCFRVNSKPVDETIEAEDQAEAEDMIDDMYDDKNDASFDVNVKVSVGSGILRRAIRSVIHRLTDKGNSFTLSIKYEYFQYDVEEIEPEDDDDEKETVIDLSFIPISSSNGRDYF